MVVENPPHVVVELFDNDQVVGGTFSRFCLDHFNDDKLKTS